MPTKIRKDPTPTSNTSSPTLGDSLSPNGGLNDPLGDTAPWQKGSPNLSSPLLNLMGPQKVTPSGPSPTPDKPSTHQGVNAKLDALLANEPSTLPKKKVSDEFKKELRFEAGFAKRKRVAHRREKTADENYNELHDDQFSPNADSYWRTNALGGNEAYDEDYDDAMRERLRLIKDGKYNQDEHTIINLLEAKGKTVGNDLETPDDKAVYGHINVDATDGSNARAEVMKAALYKTTAMNMKGFDSDLTNMLAKIPPKRLKKYRELGLHDEELAAITLYTTEWFHDLNTKLRNGNELAASEKRYMRIIRSGLDKLPKGITLNGTAVGEKLDNSKGRQELIKFSRVYRYFKSDALFAKLYQPSGTATEAAMMSTTVRPPGSGNNVMVIDGAEKGTPIAGLSHVTHEDEVLFAPPTKMVVTDAYDGRIGKNVKTLKANPDDYTASDYAPDKDLGFEGKKMVARMKIVQGGKDNGSNANKVAPEQGDNQAIKEAQSMEAPEDLKKDPVLKALEPKMKLPTL